MSRLVEPLPRGRHGLTREEVVSSQRERILLAMAETMAAKGYAATSVADVLRAARVSRETFYEQFSSKADCFMSAFEAAVGILLARMSEALEAGGPAAPAPDPVRRLEDALGAYLDALASEPAFARLFLVEVFAAGPEALARRARSQQQFVEWIDSVIGARTPEERFAIEAFVAATSSLVTSRLAAGDLEGLRALRKPLTRLAQSMLAESTS